MSESREPQYEVAVIGAGFGGIGAGIKLKQAGIDDFVIVEQSGDVGGTWRDNTYPGVAVDVASFSYSFSFEPNPRWSRAYAPGAELKRYAEHCVDKYRLRPHLRLNTKVTHAEFDEVDHLWRGKLADGSTMTARYVIAAVGGLTQPKNPDIPGLDDYAGRTMHTARWDHDNDLTGQRVAIVGTGATSVQVVPAIADRVERLHVFQRTPIWCAPKPDVPLPPPVQAVFRRVPGTQLALRALSNALTETVMTLGIVHNRQLPVLVKAIEAMCLAHLRWSVPDKELRAKLTPQYGFGCKRPSFSNDYWRSFMREDVELVTDPIERVTERGIRTRDGVEREVDTLILATGFKVFEVGNTPPFPIVGVGGQELGDFWEAERYQSYHGASVPFVPNAFTVIGPYGFTGACYFQLIENQTRHALRCITEARRRGATYVAVKQQAHDRYFARVQRRVPSTVFYNNDCGGAHSYYFDKHGDAPLLRPDSSVKAWWDSHRFDLDDYHFATGEQDTARVPA